MKNLHFRLIYRVTRHLFIFPTLLYLILNIFFCFTWITQKNTMKSKLFCWIFCVFFFCIFAGGFFFVYPSVQFVTPYNMIGKIHNSKNSVFLSVCGAFELVLPMRACLPIFFFCLLCVHRGKIIFGVLSKLVGGNHQRWTQKQ